MEKSAYGPLPDMEAATRGHVVSAALSHPSPGSDAGSGRRTSSAGGSQRRLTVDGVTVDHEGEPCTRPCLALLRLVGSQPGALRPNSDM